MTDDRFDSLFRSCQKDLLRFFRRRVGSPETADELTQETFLRLLRAEPAGALRDPKAYLYRTAFNLLTDHYRWMRTRRETPDAGADLNTLRDPNPTAESVVMSREELGVLRRAIDSLPPRGREIFVLHKFHGLSYAEIAARLGIAKNTVMVHMVRSLARCKKELDVYHRGIGPDG